ncbi:hypothetical protein PENTCL1PPCAC_19388, partial [Pristionchus entomophagus]
TMTGMVSSPKWNGPVESSLISILLLFSSWLSHWTDGESSEGVVTTSGTWLDALMLLGIFLDESCTGECEAFMPFHVLLPFIIPIISLIVDCFLIGTPEDVPMEMILISRSLPTGTIRSAVLSHASE